MMPSAMVLTDEGPVPAEWLRAGDRVLTRDKGFQPLIWVGRKARADTDSPTRPMLLIETSALTDATPRQTALLHPDTKVLVRSRHPQSRLDMGEALCCASVLHAAGRAQEVAPQANMTFCTLFFEEHEVILVDDIWLNSSRVTPAAMAQLTGPERATLRFRMGTKGIYQSPSRPSVSDEEALAILGLPQTKPTRLLTAEVDTETRRKRVANG